MSETRPLVSIVTPVYNGESYLAECIESVLAQTYQEWEYIIVNNRSTDRTLEIARSYAGKDDRIRIIDNETFVDVIQNHNIAFQSISGSSKYCKIVQADDLLFPECVARMVALCEENPGVGVVGAYSLTGNVVKSGGLEYPESIFPGREVAKRTLLGQIYPFLSPSSSMVRASFIHKNNPYYCGEKLDADMEAIFRDFTECDFGFIYQILTYVRRNPDSVTARDKKGANSQLLSHIRLLRKYGPVYLEQAECRDREAELWKRYYQQLALHALRFYKRPFWRNQIEELEKIGCSFDRPRLVKSVLRELVFWPRRSAYLMKNALFPGRQAAASGMGSKR